MSAHVHSGQAGATNFGPTASITSIAGGRTGLPHEWPRAVAATLGGLSYSGSTASQNPSSASTAGDAVPPPAGRSMGRPASSSPSHTLATCKHGGCAACRRLNPVLGPGLPGAVHMESLRNDDELKSSRPAAASAPFASSQGPDTSISMNPADYGIGKPGDSIEAPYDRPFGTEATPAAAKVLTVEDLDFNGLFNSVKHPHSTFNVWLRRMGPVAIAAMLFFEYYMIWQALWAAPVAEWAVQLPPNLRLVVLALLGLECTLILLSLVQASRIPPALLPPDEVLELNNMPLEVLRMQQNPVLDQQLTVCKYCQRHRPRNAHHCRICGGCVLNFDHHCPAINNCVNVANYKQFVLLLIHGTVALAMVSLASFCVGHSWAVVRELLVRIWHVLSTRNIWALSIDTDFLLRHMSFLELCAQMAFVVLHWLLLFGLANFAGTHIMLISDGKSTLDFIKWGSTSLTPIGINDLVRNVINTKKSLVHDRMRSVFGSSFPESILPFQTRRNQRLRMEAALSPLRYRHVQSA